MYQEAYLLQMWFTLMLQTAQCDSLIDMEAWNDGGQLSIHRNGSLDGNFILFDCYSSVQHIPFIRRSTRIPSVSSRRHINFGVGNPSALQVRVTFWCSRTATVLWVECESNIFGGTEMENDIKIIYRLVKGIILILYDQQLFLYKNFIFMFF